MNNNCRNETEGNGVLPVIIDYYDIFPQNPDFFVFANSPERHSEDFLTGCTVNLRESESIIREHTTVQPFEGKIDV